MKFVFFFPYFYSLLPHGDTVGMQNVSVMRILQCSQKVSFHPETGPEFPQNEKNPKIFGTSLSP